MKILQVLPELNSGGVEEVTLSYAKYLQEQGHESLVLSNGGEQVTKLEAEGSRHLKLPVHKKSPFSLRSVPTLKKLLLSEQPDIMHLRSRVPAWLMMLAWQQLPKTKRPKVVTTVHGFYSINRYSSIMTKGERVLCVSESIKDYVLKNYPNTPPERIRVIFEGINEERYFPEFKPATSWLSQWQQEFPETIGKTLLTLPGRITRLKGHPDFLKLIAQLRKENPDIHGLVVGGAHPRKEAYLEEMKALTRELALDEHVTFTGPRSDLREILSHSDLSFSLSQQPESFGLTVLEALSLGTPVIGYDRGGVAEILAELFPDGAIPAVAESLLRKTTTVLASPPTIGLNLTFQSQKVHHETLAQYHELLES